MDNPPAKPRLEKPFVACMRLCLSKGKWKPSMKKPYDHGEGRENLGNKAMASGGRSIRKSYYPELRQQVAELERFRALTDQSRDAILLALMPSWRLVDVNESACRRLGLVRKEFLGLTMMDLVPPSSWEKISVLLPDQTTPGGDGLTIAASLRKRDGDYVRAEMTVRLVAFSDAVYAVIVARDVSERERAEKALRESEEKLRAVIHGSAVPQYFISRDHSVLYWNKALEDYTGIRAEEMVGTRDHWKAFYRTERPCLADLLVDGDIEVISRWFGGKYRRSTLVEGAYEAVDFFPAMGRTGIWLQFTAVAIKDSTETVIGALETAVDITERKTAEEALHRSEEKYRGIFENAIEGIFQATPEGRYLSVNPSYARMHGFESPREMVESITDIANQIFVRPGDRDRLLETLEEKGFVIKYETEHLRKDGSRIWTSMNVRTVRSPEGRTLYHEGTALNITERRRLEARLLQTQKMEAIGTLAAGIAHDFNNILSVLMGYGVLMQSAIEKDSPLQGYLETMLASTEKGTNLTKSLLAFGRQQVMTLKPVDINSLITEMQKLLKRLITAEINLRTDLAATEMMIMADTTQIDQILLNLVINSRDAMPEGGTLTIATEMVDLGIEFARSHGLEKAGKYLLMSVSDTGTGMDQETKEHIFDPFFTTKEQGKGTGLGLSTVYGIVRQHNGYITVHSEPGRGTSFYVYLPLTSEKAAKESPAPRLVKGGDETILVADDDEGTRHLMRDLLRKYGYTVIEAVDGEDAVNLFRENSVVSLLILDSVMPGKSGRAAYDEIRQTDNTVKVLFISGYTEDAVLRKGFEDNSFGFLAKPVAPYVLLKKVRELLDRKAT